MAVNKDALAERRVALTSARCDGAIVMAVMSRSGLLLDRFVSVMAAVPRPDRLRRCMMSPAVVARVRRLRRGARVTSVTGRRLDRLNVMVVVVMMAMNGRLRRRGRLLVVSTMVASSDRGGRGRLDGGVSMAAVVIGAGGRLGRGGVVAAPVVMGGRVGASARADEDRGERGEDDFRRVEHPES